MRAWIGSGFSRWNGVVWKVRCNWDGGARTANVLAAASLNEAVIPLHCGPLDIIAMEFHSDAIAVVRQLLTISYLPAGRITVQWSNPYRVAQLPDVFRKDASTAWTDVIGIRPLLFSIGTCRLTVREAHHDDNGQPPFRPATELVVQRNLA